MRRLKSIFKYFLFPSLFICLIVILTFFSIGCSVLFPTKYSLQDRLAHLPDNWPVKDKVNIYWNDFAVPFIEAQNDDDLAFALGVVHAHLRGGQISFLRMVAQGRISEMGGPFTEDIDHLLRIVNLAKATDEIEKNLPTATRSWLENFVKGLNYYQEKSTVQPPEFGLMNIRFEPWSVKDVLTLVRLAGTDVTWLLYFSMLENRAAAKDFPANWLRILEDGKTDLTSFKNDSIKLETLKGLIKETSRSGSNSVVIAGSKSITGNGLIHNDPHLGFNLPNFWILAGVHSPNLNVAGMMIPGVPIFGLGRNQDIAWGGTNMRAASSDIVKIEEQDLTTSREENIKNRFWFDRKKVIRESNYGPVISDADLIKEHEGELLALRWSGHYPSDEVSAFLNAAKAKNIPQFIKAFETFAVSAQNILFVDRYGNIGHILAAWLPKRKNFENSDFVISKAKADSQWESLFNSGTLPYMVNPEEGYLASANNKPVSSEFPIAFAFSEEQRIARLKELLSSKDKVSIEDLKKIPLDVYSSQAMKLKNDLLPIIPSNIQNKYHSYLDTLRAWDGFYHSDSKGALHFEILLSVLVERYFKNADISFKEWRYVSRHLAASIPKMVPHLQDEIWELSLEEAAERVKNYKTWGDMHRIKVGGVLSSIPVIGRLFTEERMLAGGSRETLMKSAHSFEKKLHNSRYGSQSRHYSDMSTPDQNYFVLFGGQDGFPGSQNYVDQVNLWKSGEYVQIPLTMDAVRQKFQYKTELKPN